MKQETIFAQCNGKYISYLIQMIIGLKNKLFLQVPILEKKSHNIGKVFENL